MVSKSLPLLAVERRHSLLRHLVATVWLAATVVR